MRRELFWPRRVLDFHRVATEKAMLRPDDDMLRDGRVVETGSNRGRTTAALASGVGHRIFQYSGSFELMFESHYLETCSRWNARAPWRRGARHDRRTRAARVQARAGAAKAARLLGKTSPRIKPTKARDIVGSCRNGNAEARTREQAGAEAIAMIQQKQEAKFFLWPMLVHYPEKNRRNFLIGAKFQGRPFATTPPSVNRQPGGVPAKSRRKQCLRFSSEGSPRVYAQASKNPG
jgi:hypothetical protein